MTHHSTSFTTDEALLLQYLYEAGEDDTQSLADSVGLSQSAVIRLIRHLKAKNLARVRYWSNSVWVGLTNRGKRLVCRVWPEAQAIAA